MLLQKSGDGWVTIGPVAFHCDHICLLKCLLRAGYINGSLFVHMASDAPVCGKVDKDGFLLLPKFGQAVRVKVECACGGGICGGINGRLVPRKGAGNEDASRQREYGRECCRYPDRALAIALAQAGESKSYRQ